MGYQKKGFTLIELFIAVSIFSIVALALYSTFFAGISVWKRSGEGSDIYQDVRLAIDEMTRDLRNAIYCSKAEESVFTFVGTTEEMTFITLEDIFSEEDVLQRELVRIGYDFDKGKGELIKVLANRSLGFDIEKAEKEIALRGLEDFKFSYCYDSGDEDEPYLWKDNWEDKERRVPRGIKVSFLIKDEKKKEPLEFTRTVFVPIGSLGEKELGL